ncbi:hypothetical protein JIN85_05655 [Luteolibacter pohnpeiensis]|uniref:Thiol:disulfide interchange protein DsbD N-terminal domain-containing protein n=1 Tax=Luteolibacter pohnpeiensis TaxID=454153 RepID=A0A934S9M5_9BACT|nr:protein-disulfide reductase DsbD domain-containing protein [Luteolibacter pohnpeiensis]MBK1881889.1 hypothetical protein [Luteolibacter pohnpeiensis]
MLFKTALFLAASGSLFAQEVHSGHAAASWLTESETFEPGKPIQTAVQLRMEPGWHSYWLNPGEAGMKLSLKWDLPDGWKASDVSYPVPISFNTGGLAGFGYINEATFPITLTPPDSASNPSQVGLKISWLTCNDNACVPGDAELTLKLAPGTPSPSDSAEIISKAIAEVPKTMDGVTLSVSEVDSALKLTLKIPADSKIDPSACEVFPASASTVKDQNPIRFEKDGAEWAATATKSDYLDGPVKELTLVLAGKGTPKPIEVSWSAN